MATTFSVDRVTPVLEPLAARTLATSLSESLGRSPLAVSHEAPLIEAGAGLHPLVQAVHLAFSEHRPLTLSPDHLWLTLAQGFAIHVDENAEALRARFVRHQGRAKIEVPVLALPESADDWAAVIPKFGRGVEGHVGPGLHRLLVCQFSTTTATERIASEVVMMSAFRKYFDYALRCICGIPEITLEGSPEDWAELRRRAEILAEYDLEWWLRGLRPVLAQLEASAQGRPDPDFWACIYKPQEVYGGELTTGWLMRLFPYLQPRSGLTERNPMVLAATAGSDRAAWIGPGQKAEDAPLGLSVASLRVQGQTVTRQVSLYGGLAGVRQLPDGRLRPEAAWAVAAPAPMSALLVQIDEQAPRPKVSELSHRHAMPAALIELYDHCDGALLFDRWNLLPSGALHTVVGSVEDGFYELKPGHQADGGYSPASALPIIPFCTLQDDPRYFALFEGERTEVVLVDPRIRQNAEEIRVIEGGLERLLTLIFEHRGENWLANADGPALYDRLPSYHEYLRRGLTVGAGPPPSDLGQREQEQLVLKIAAGQASKAQIQFWWQALQASTGTAETFDDLFGRRLLRRRPTPYDLMIRLGIRPPLPDE